MIQKRVQEHYDHIKNKYNVLCVMLQGSQNYGLALDTPDYKSDIDTKAIVLPSFEDFCRNKTPISTTLILDNNEHIDVKDIRVMFDCFKKQNINFLEILFTDYIVVNPKYEHFIGELRNMAEEIVRIDYNQALNCIVGMSMQKLKALKHPYPTILHKIEQYGYDPKQLHHIARMNDFIKKFVANKTYKECLIPDHINYLIELKTQPMALDKAEELAHLLDKETYIIKEQHYKKDNVVNEDTIEKLYDLSYRIIKEHLKGELNNGY